MSKPLIDWPVSGPGEDPLYIAFMGSATDPSHLGHQAALQRVLSARIYDLVMWYPSGFSKYKPYMLDGIHRQQYAQLAFPEKWIFAPNPGWARLMLNLSATMMEDVPTGLRYQELRDQYPNSVIHFITGSDSITPDKEGVIPITQWKKQKALRKVPIRIIPRMGFALPGDVQFPKKFKDIEWFCDQPVTNRDISSSTIRQLVKCQQHLPKEQQTWRDMMRKQAELYTDLYRIYA